MHFEDYRRRVDAFARGQGRRLELLREETQDTFGRFSGRIAVTNYFS